MSKISDMIEKFINELMEASKGYIEIQRNELASYFNCAPSQINYVLTTRFTADRGYSIESKRGGGGCIKITRVIMDETGVLNQMLSEKIGRSVGRAAAFEIVEILYLRGYIGIEAKSIIKSVVDDSVLSVVPVQLRDILRAEILKAAIIAAIINRGS